MSSVLQVPPTRTVRRHRRGWLVLAAALAVCLLVTEPALAASANDVGGNLGKILRAWAQGLLFACAGFAGISAVMRQDLGQAVVIFLVVMFVGAFVYAPTKMEAVIVSVWSTATGTTTAQSEDPPDVRGKGKRPR